MKRYALALLIVLLLTFVVTYLWARTHFPSLFPAR